MIPIYFTVVLCWELLVEVVAMAFNLSYFYLGVVYGFYAHFDESVGIWGVWAIFLAEVLPYLLVV